MQYIVFLIGIALAFGIINIFVRRKIYLKYNKWFCAGIVALAVAFSLEVFAFNYNFFQGTEKYQRNLSIDVTTSDVKVIEEQGDWDSRELDMECSVDKSTSGEQNKYTVEINNIDTKLKDLDVIPDYSGKSVSCQLYYTDDANSNFTKSGDTTVIVHGIDSSSHIRPNFAGETHHLRIEMTTDTNTEIKSVQIKLNYPIGFSFNFLRIILIFVLIFICLMIYLTKGSEAIQFNKHSTKQLAVIIAFVAVEVIFTMFLSAAGNMQFDNNGKYQGINWESSDDAYHELTLALSQGKVDLNNLDPQTAASEQEGIAKLQALQNPYEWGQRTDIYYKWDRAFYNGKYYCYFGIVPAILFYLPYYFITGHMLRTKLLVMFLVMISEMLMAALVYGIAGQYKKRLNLWVVIGAMAGFINVSMILYCINGSKFYEVATVSALLCALAGLDLIVRAFEKKESMVWKLGLGALFMALSVGCRPNYVLISFMAACLMLNGLAKNGGYQKSVKGQNVKGYFTAIFSKENIASIASIAVPYVIVAAGLMYYNFIRFGSITEFGAKYQLTVFDTSYYGLYEIGKLPLMIARCLFIFPNMSSIFPYINAVSESSNFVGYYYDMTYMGIFAHPIMWLSLLLLWSFRRGIKDMGHKGFVAVSVIVAFLMCYITTTMGGTSLRYSVDFAWLFFIPVIYIMFDLYDRGRKKGITKYILISLSLLVFATVLMSTLMCLSPSWSVLSSKVPEVFYRIEEMVVFWK